MELKDFVRETIQNIVAGVAEAQSATKDLGAVVNPSGLHYYKEGQQNTSTHALPQDVLFNVGLTSMSKDGSSEGIGVFLGGVTLGKKNDSGTEDVAVTSVQFTVPIVLPAGASMRPRRK
jgi:hypothetical protein